MKDLDRFSWPPRRSDFVMVAGFGIVVYSIVAKEWGIIAVGALILLTGFLAPRMKGPFSLGTPKLSFKGELVDPSERDPPTVA